MSNITRSFERTIPNGQKWNPEKETQVLVAQDDTNIYNGKPIPVGGELTCTYRTASLRIKQTELIGALKTSPTQYQASEII